MLSSFSSTFPQKTSLVIISINKKLQQGEFRMLSTGKIVTQEKGFGKSFVVGAVKMKETQPMNNWTSMVY